MFSNVYSSRFRWLRMVTLAEEFDTLYPVDTSKAVFLKGFVSGNYGMFNRHWFNTTANTIKPGMGLLRATGGAEHTVTGWANECLVGYGVAGWDKTQTAAQSTAYATADLIPVYPFAENPGAIFQGYVKDTDGNMNADTDLDAGAVTGSFKRSAAQAFPIYAMCLYYIADTTETAQLVLMYVAQGSGG